MKKYKIASIAGDGIGLEVVPPALKILKEVAKNIILKFILMNLIFLHAITMKSMEKCCQMIGKIKLVNTTLFFLVQLVCLNRVPDHISLWGSIITFRREFDQYVKFKTC